MIATKANANAGRVAILNPLKALSLISAEGQAFHDPSADAALFESIRQHAKVEVIDLQEEINSPAFAQACVEKLLQLIESES